MHKWGKTEKTTKCLWQRCSNMVAFKLKVPKKRILFGRRPKKTSASFFFSPWLGLKWSMGVDFLVYGGRPPLHTYDYYEDCAQIYLEWISRCKLIPSELYLQSYSQATSPLLNKSGSFGHTPIVFDAEASLKNQKMALLVILRGHF